MMKLKDPAVGGQGAFDDSARTVSEDEGGDTAVGWQDGAAGPFAVARSAGVSDP